MATANAQICGNGDGSFNVALTYDTTSLLIQSVTYQNTTSQRGSVSFGSPVNQTVFLQPNTPTTTHDVSAFNIHMVMVTPNKGPAVAAPPVQVNCAWPA